MGNNWPEKQNKEECIDKIRNEFTPEQFRREYLCEPKIKSLPSIVEFQNGERLEWQPSSQREVEEYIKRCNLQPYIQEPDGNGIAILKLPSLSPEQIKKFKEEWQKFVNTSQPITSVDPECERCSLKRLKKVEAKEYLLCAAIRRVEPRDCPKVYWEQFHDIYKIELGWRHPDILHRFGKEVSRNPKDQGFYTSKGRFVTREEGLEIARASGQVKDIIGGVLTSEDLY